MSSTDHLHDELVPDRRPIEMRQMHWPHAITHVLVGMGITPNQVSVASLVFSAIGAVGLLISTQHEYHIQLLGLCVFAICIQVRLVANMVDGMVAVEGKKLSSVGKLYNEVPDRISDTICLVAAGYAATLLGAGEWATWAGWTAAMASVFTAYVRVLGGSVGLPYDFSGAFDKQHRMFYLSLALMGAAFEVVFFRPPTILAGALPVIAVGSLATALTRIYHMGRDLRLRGKTMKVQG